MKKTTFLLLSFYFCTFYLTHAQIEKKPLYDLTGHFAEVKSLDFSQDGKYLTTLANSSAPKKSEIKVWNPKTGKIIENYQDNIFFQDISIWDNYFFTVGKNIHLKYWSLKNQRQRVLRYNVIHNVRKEDQNMAMIKILKSSMYDSRYRTTIVQVSNKDADSIPQQVLIGSREIRSNFEVWESSETVFEISKNYIIRDINVNQDNKYLAFAGKDIKTKEGFIQVVLASTTTTQSVQKIHTKSAVNSVALSPNGELLIGALENGQLLIWETKTAKIVKDLTADSLSITKVVFSPDGNFILSASANSIKLWELNTGKVLQTFVGHTAQINDLAFSPKGNIFASVSDDKTVKVWEVHNAFERVKIYVEEKMNVWQEKGRYEKTAEYRARVSPEKRKTQIGTYTQEAINLIAKENINLSITASEYDADHEVFKLSFEDIPPIFVKVPIADAPDFDKGLEKKIIKIEEGNFTLNADAKMALLNARIRNKQNNRRYTFNSENLLAFNPTKLKLNFKPVNIKINTPKSNIQSDISRNIPQTKMKNNDAIAVIIGNSYYEKTKDVDFAQNDASLIKQYLIQTLGYKEGNVFHLENIRKSDFELYFGTKDNYKGKLFNTVKAKKSEVFIYYSGHGVPSIKSKSAYFAPVECDPNYVELSGYSLDIFYNNLAQVPAKSMTIVLDACFSGADIYENISPITIKPKGIVGIKNGTLLTSCQGSEVSSWYNEKGHSLFTYFFLKAIHNKNADADNNGKLTFQEIQNYISNKTEAVPYFARRLHGIEQNPTLQGEDLGKVFINY